MYPANVHPFLPNTHKIDIAQLQVIFLFFVFCNICSVYLTHDVKALHPPNTTKSEQPMRPDVIMHSE